MVGLLFVVFVVVPLVELYVVVQVAQGIGVLPTIALLILVSALGAWLMKREGVGVWRRLQTSVQQGRSPTNDVVDGAILLAAGTLCLVPGFVTDAVGLLLLVPPIRALVRNRLIRRYRARSLAGGRAGVVIDVEHLGDVTPRPRPGTDLPPELGGGR